MKGREWYREFHEQDHEHGEIWDGDKEEFEDLEDCPYCKHEKYCTGGCGLVGHSGYKFEKKEDEK